MGKGMSMRDLIDERNRREKLKNSIIKGYNVHYVTQEELARQKEEEERKRQQEAAERLRLEEAAKKVALELERRREMEQRELLEQAKMPPSSRYGTTKEQINAILAEKRQKLDKVIHDSQTEEWCAMSDVAKRQERSEEQKEQEKTKKELNPEWSQDAQDELQDFIESQGFYIRQ